MDIQAAKKRCEAAMEALKSCTLEHHCQHCNEDKKIAVRIEHEYGEFGSVLSSWPEFDVEPRCLGFHDPEGDIDLLKPVTPEMIEEDELTEIEIERAQERCAFYYEEPWDNPDGAWVLGMNQERARQRKVLSDLPAALEALEGAQGEIERLEKLPLQFAVHGADRCSAQLGIPCPTCSKIADLERQLAEAKARLRKANCDYGDGWLSDDLECQVDVEPWCGKHAVLYYIRANKEAQRILVLDDSRLLTAVQNTARALKERDEAQGKLEAVEVAAVKRGIFLDSEASTSGSDGIEAWYCVFCEARVDAEVAAAEDVEHLADCILSKEGE
jgi:hypothetical protein